MAKSPKRSKKPKVTPNVRLIPIREMRHMATTISTDPDFQREPKLGRWTHALAGYIFANYFGREWVEYYIYGQHDKFLRTRPGNWQGVNIHNIRYVTLAEMIFNFQHHDGFEGCLRVIGDGNIEAGYTELEVAKTLTRSNVEFSFNKRTQKTKMDYDLNVRFQNGHWGCAETECKLESTRISEETMLDTLRKARRQLPNDKPGVVFLKLPQNWTEESEFQTKLHTAIGRFFKGYKKYRGTSTVVSVETFTTILEFRGIVVEHLTLGLENMSYNHKFDKSVDWVLIGESSLPETPNYPVWWKLLPCFFDPKIDPRLFKA